MGAAISTPSKPGLPSPSALPTHTPTAYRGVTPAAQASRNPKLVPVFQATCLLARNNSHSPALLGRSTSRIASKVYQMLPAPSNSGFLPAEALA